ncbi:malonyl-ACP O-methyltransferase BioC [Enterobacteriaceae bacterium BIT-l23]|uniref:malonyl-ACP O-methyltransferase BioC n=1 Tax=Jejubacter sp. L23 TaxID=3092086 RepID=UPI0015849C28|nr:malonyl-ACP O-methyltransferase BioC [Enterobacteriaceae bacterium BIT-l23]
MTAVNKQAVAGAFGRAAATYDRFAELQRLSGQRLMQEAGERTPDRVLDAGCGTGFFSHLWRQRGSQVIALDLAPAMLTRVRACEAAHHCVQGDIEALPLATDSVELAWSSLAVQWCSSLSRGLSELKRVTRPGGRVLFSTLCDGSLPELHQAWRAVDSQRHANRFLTAGQIARAADAPGMRWFCETVRLHFADPLSAMRSLKGIGATHLHDGRTARTLTRSQLKALTLAWPQHEGQFPLSYQLFYGVIEK